MMEALTGKKEMIRQLKEKILAMEGFGSVGDARHLDFGLGQVNHSFPGGIFPVGAMHEFVSPAETSFAAANGFISGLLSTLLKNGGICMWISAGRKLFPPALKFFGIEPHRIIFIDVRTEKETLWVMEQALKNNSLAAVVAELRNVSFAESRRLQLAVSESRVTGFLHRHSPYINNTLACVSRWQIRPIASRLPEELPGVGFPRWEVELMKIRNGKPGIWQLEWQDGVFRHLTAQKQVVSDSITTKKERYA
jgi:protein ImuA